MLEDEKKATSEQPKTKYDLLNDMYAPAMQSVGEEIAYEEALQKQREERAKGLTESARKAREEGKSYISGLFENTKPKYDEKREKNLRNRAIVQSVGDMLSAAMSGIIAYNKKTGAGYVPQLKNGGALESLNEISRMREEYQKRNQAWDDFMLEREVKDKEAEIAAAEKLAAAAEKNVLQGNDNVAKAKEKADKLTGEYRRTLARYIQEDEKVANADAKAEEKAYSKAEQAKQKETEDAYYKGIVDAAIATFGEKSILGEKESTTTGERPDGTPYTTKSSSTRSIYDLDEKEVIALGRRLATDKRYLLNNLLYASGQTDADTQEMLNSMTVPEIEEALRYYESNPGLRFLDVYNLIKK